ncbi:MULTISPECIES: (2Fe-2S)-binding protein [Kordiimonas]|jgi:isoquinoline 1-oxidoreductase alpha subunit|uniref:(2Fe-2S)-binding protein n=1 Tax=Kordiimonas TaxID=288021 RepID=UPI00257A26BA|nr:(2Fe-2S)-binding protein [Kordiimonas sp. UBA4487]
MSVALKINGRSVSLDLPEDMPLLWALRDTLGLTGTKYGCGQGLCGACTVHLDGVPVRACQTQLADAEGMEVVTLEAIKGREMAALRDAWAELNVAQCGYCQAGQLMSAAALLADTPNPDDADIDAAMAGNICRCGTYGRIRKAIREAASRL